MDPTDIPLFDLAESRLGWLGRRQQVLAQNIANADTPGWQDRDLPSFASTLAQTAQTTMAPVRTDPQHLAGTVAANAPLLVRRERKAERSPDGNGVALDQQIRRVADTDTAHALVSGLYKSFLGMFRTAIGHS
jgi:flagellar basal-body rod protein FlgB